MPRVGPRRANVIVRMSDQGIAMLDQIAEEEATNRSETVRRLIKEAITARIAKGWRPKEQQR